MLGQPLPTRRRVALDAVAGYGDAAGGSRRPLHTLENTFQKAKLGHGEMVLISGEPGIGKSRLMQEFAMRARSRALVLAGAGFPETKTCPYQPIVEALRPHLAMRRFEFDAYPPWLAELAQLFSELRPLHPGLPPAGEPDWRVPGSSRRWRRCSCGWPKAPLRRSFVWTTCSGPTARP